LAIPAESQQMFLLKVKGAFYSICPNYDFQFKRVFTFRSLNMNTEALTIQNRFSTNVSAQTGHFNH
jgi:hypothetical protein